MLVEVIITSLDGLCTLSVFVPKQKRITKTFKAAYEKLASVANVSFCFWQATYTIDGSLYIIDSNIRAHKLL